MSYIKLQVRSGGIYIRQKKDFKPIDLNLITHPENKSQKVLSLVRDSSIKGLFSYLMGETGRLSYNTQPNKEYNKSETIENSQDHGVKKLNTTLNKMVELSAYKKRSEPHVTVFFERKDTHAKGSRFITCPSINLYQHTFKTADPTIKLLEKPLNNILQSKPQSLGEIHTFFKKHTHAKGKKEYEELKKQAKKTKNNLKNIPDSKLKEGIKTALKRIEDEKPISSQVIILVEETCDLCSQDKGFFKKIKDSSYGKFSVFTDLSNTKQWVNTDCHSIVRGAPAYIACVDFDIYLSESNFVENNSSETFPWEEIVDKLKAGPNIARWGEGGVVFVDYSGLDEMGCPHDTKDQMFIDIQALRKAGLKVKRYDWEPEKNSNVKTKKIKGEKH